MAAPESLKTRLFRIFFNFFPAYRGTGARVEFIAGDWKEVRIRLPLSWRTRNYVGTIFGGSLYACTDPIYMIMLMKLLGPGYIVWDKASNIRFKKPGRANLYARFALDDAEIAEIRRLADAQRSVDRTYLVQLVDREGLVHAEVDKILYIRRKDKK
jgi:acyl-coenzyme A thioesterase PaaI-like protein